MQEDRRYYIYGAGKNGLLLLSIMRKVKLRVEAFIDQDINKWGREFCGIKCISLENASALSQAVTVLISVGQSEGIEEKLSYNFETIYDLGKILSKLHHFFPLTTCDEDYKRVAPFNYYESPYPDIVEIHKNEKKIFEYKKVEEIDFNLDRQFELMDAFASIPLLNWDKYPIEELRYYSDNNFFTQGCAHILQCMMCTVKPKRIIEVGSGFSTAVMLDVNEHCFNNNIHISSIEPYPDRLRSLLRSTDQLCIYEKRLEDMPLDFFESLDENDILFIDSSHVSKINSDVNYIFFEILPRLKSGVYIHFHDIFYPFIYPKAWIYEGRAYNEMYMLRTFLMNNIRYKIQLFPDMLVQEKYRKECEMLNSSTINSIYLRKE